MMNITPVVKQLLIINIIFYIGSNFVGDYAYDLLSLHYPESDSFKVWQPLTHMFMHAPWPSFTHILFNMYALFIFGSPLEHYWGAKRFLLFYIICGLGAAFVQLGVNYYQLHETLSVASNMNLAPNVLHQILNVNFAQGNYSDSKLFEEAITPILKKNGSLNLLNNDNLMALYYGAMQANSTMVGASGAIYGLLIAFAFMFPDAGLMLLFVPYPIKAKYFVPVLVLLDLFSGVTGFSIFGGGVAHFAHVGGALFGFIIMWFWRRKKFTHNRWD